MPETIVIAMNSLRLGGSQTYGLELARRLNDTGMKVIVVAKTGPLAAVVAESHEYRRALWREGSAITPRGGMRRVVLSALEQVTAQSLLQRIPQPMAVIVSQPWPMHFFAEIMHKRWQSARVFGLVHGTGSTEFPPPLSDRVLPVFERFFTTTPETQRMLESKRLPATQLGNLFDGASYWGSPPKVVEESREKRIILSLGTLTPNKTPPVLALLEVVRDRPGWEVKVAGDGPDRTSLEDFAILAGLGARVQFLGGVTDPRPHILNADAVMAAGRAAMEAGSAARPVIIGSSEGVHGLLKPSGLAVAAAANFTGRSQDSVPVSYGAISHHLDAVESLDASSLYSVQKDLWQWGDIQPLLARLKRLPDRT